MIDPDLKILALVQYRIFNSTVTFARPPSMDDILSVDMFLEINGSKPETGQPLDYHVGKDFIFMGRQEEFL